MYTRVRDVPITRTPDYTVDTKDYYARHVGSAEDAVQVVKSGDHVAICRGREPEALGLALAARKDELQNVKLTIPQPGRDNGMFDDASWGESFQVQVGIVTKKRGADSATNWAQGGIAAVTSPEDSVEPFAEADEAARRARVRPRGPLDRDRRLGARLRSAGRRRRRAAGW